MNNPCEYLRKSCSREEPYTWHKGILLGFSPFIDSEVVTIMAMVHCIETGTIKAIEHENIRFESEDDK